MASSTAVLFLLPWLQVASAALYNFTIAKPNCIDSCGNISIPFPFGTTKDCIESDNYFITCNQSYNPPKPFLRASNIEITDISLDGQLTLLPLISRQCYSRNGIIVSDNEPFQELPVHFTVNNTANKFTIVGCDSYGFISDREPNGGYKYKAGCTAMCDAKDDLIEGSCTGLGCCQTWIPKDIWRFDLSLNSYNQHRDVWDFNNCSYAFLAKENAFSFSVNNLTSLNNVALLPMVADWAMGNGTCEEAQMNRSAYACRSEYSECYKPDNGYGYRCACLKGYEGNPYLSDGCKAATLYNFPITKRNCNNSCGSISIPFPFGTTKDCIENNNYFINCDRSYNPPKPFLQTSNTEITDITLDGQLTLLQRISHQCYNQNGTRVSNYEAFLKFPVPFIVNTTANKFTIVGCDTYGSISGRRLRRSYTTGCTAMCYAKNDIIEGSCTGIGCCQISIPKDTWWVNLSLNSYSNHSHVGDFNNCSYAFLAQDSTFSFSADNLTSLNGVALLPVVVDWAMGNRTCEEGQMNLATYACRSSNSKCYNRNNGYGYRCSCSEGYEGNPYLSDGCIDINECEANLHNCEKKEYCENKPGNFSCRCPKGYHGNGTKVCLRDESPVFKLVAGISVGVIIMMLAACWLYLELKRRRLVQMRQKFFLQNGGNLLQEKLAQLKESSDSLKLFTEAELQKATNKFHRSMVIGHGGYGTVYKGSLPDNRTVAIKRSKQVDPNLVDKKQVEQFVNEVFIFSQINHRNVVKFLGWCVETQEPLLVYDFMVNGTLFEHIHNKEKSRSLTWDIRLRIATETAGVLSYLHSQASTPIIHRDVKSANILLDHTFTAKVSDFGASRLAPLDHTQLPTAVQGTLGYLDPEYMQTSQLTEKSDVYSFGVVLVELLTGMKALCRRRPEKEQNLAYLFLSVMKEDRLIQILDESIVHEVNKDQIEKVALLAKSCLHVTGADRPCMKTVVSRLEDLGNKKRDINVDENESSLGFIHPIGHEEGNSSSLGFYSVQSTLVPDENDGR